MANRRISDLTALTDPASNDYLPIVDVSQIDSISKNKRITVEELFRGVPNGTAAAPSIAFELDPNTGIYSVGADQLAVSTNGIERFTLGTTVITSTLPISYPLGTVTAPSIALTGDSNTGIYSPGPDQLAVTTNGTQRLTVSTTETTSTLPVVFPAGLVGTPSITFSGDVNTGLYSPGADQLSVSTNGIQRLTISTTATTSTLPVVSPLGAVGTPSFTFTGDLNTGIYSPGADQVAVSTNGVARLTISTTETTSTLPIVSPSGTVGAPSITFTGDVNTGLYSPGADQIALTTNGVQRLAISTTATTSTLPIVSPLGTVSAPSLTFTGDLDTGLWSPVANTVALSTGSSERARVDSTGRLLLGTTTAQGTNSFQVEQSSGGFVSLRRAEAATAITAGEDLGGIEFQDNAGGVYARVLSEADETAGVNDFPGRLVFLVTANGASSPTEQCRIAHDGTWCWNQADPVTKTGAATLTVAEFKSGLVIHNSGTNNALTVPTGTDLEASFSNMYVGMSFAFRMLNLGVGNGNITANTGITIFGAASVANQAEFVVRRTAANTFTMYRWS